MTNEEILTAFDGQITPDMINRFDPTGDLLNEKTLDNRGIFNASQNANGKFEFGTLSLTLKNNSAGKQVVELFNPVRSITKFPNNALYADANQTDQPESPYTPFTTSSQFELFSSFNKARFNNATPSEVGFVNVLKNKAFFSDKTGNLLYVEDFSGGNLGVDSVQTTYDNNGTTLDIVNKNSYTLNDQSAKCVVSCEELPYAALVEQLNTSVMILNDLNIRVSDPAQIQKKIGFDYLTFFGEKKTNSFTLVLTPSQFQNGVYEYKKPLVIDRRTLMFWSLLGNSEVTITANVMSVRDNGVIADKLRALVGQVGGK